MQSVNYMPLARAELFRKVSRKYLTIDGKCLGKLAGAERFDLELLGEWYSYFHQCSQCRRCSVFCPYGIDTAEISMAAREIMDHIRLGQKYVNDIIVKVHDIGNNLGMNPKALKATLESTEEDLEEETGQKIRLPLDEVGAEVLMVTPSADFFASPHVESLLGYAKVFHQAGISWTFSSTASEAGNFGMFIGSYSQMQKVALRVKDAIEEIKPKRVIVGECAHAGGPAYSFWKTLIGPFHALVPNSPLPMQCLDSHLPLASHAVPHINSTTSHPTPPSGALPNGWAARVNRARPSARSGAQGPSYSASWKKRATRPSMRPKSRRATSFAGRLSQMRMPRVWHPRSSGVKSRTCARRRTRRTAASDCQETELAHGRAAAAHRQPRRGSCLAYAEAQRASPARQEPSPGRRRCPRGTPAHRARGD